MKEACLVFLNQADEFVGGLNGNSVRRRVMQIPFRWAMGNGKGGRNLHGRYRRSQLQTQKGG